MNMYEDNRKISAGKQDNGHELNDEQLDAVTGGAGGMICFGGDSFTQGEHVRLLTRSVCECGAQCDTGTLKDFYHGGVYDSVLVNMDCCGESYWSTVKIGVDMLAKL